jgi:hypothetical protein
LGGGVGFGESARVGAGRAAIGTGVLFRHHSRRKQAELLPIALGHRDDLLVAVDG